MIRRKIGMNEAPLDIMQRLFGIFVEQVQNIMNYSAERKKSSDGDIGSGDCGAIISGNDGDGQQRCQWLRIQRSVRPGSPACGS